MYINTAHLFTCLRLSELSAEDPTLALSPHFSYDAMDEEFSRMLTISEQYPTASLQKCDFSIYLEQLGYDYEQLQQGYTYIKTNVVDPASSQLTYDMTRSWSKALLWRFTGSRDTTVVDEAFISWHGYVSSQNEKFMSMAGRFDYEIDDKDYENTVKHWQDVFDKMDDLIERYRALSLCSLNLKMYLYSQDAIGSFVELVTIMIVAVMIGVVVIMVLSGRSKKSRRQKKKHMEKV